MNPVEVRHPDRARMVHLHDRRLAGRGQPSARLGDHVGNRLVVPVESAGIERGRDRRQREDVEVAASARRQLRPGDGMHERRQPLSGRSGAEVADELVLGRDRHFHALAGERAHFQWQEVVGVGRVLRVDVEVARDPAAGIDYAAQRRAGARIAAR